MSTLMPHLIRLCRAVPRSDAELLAQFLTHRDEAAFAALVQRHGPMVLGVCRRMLGDADAAEDAFQATFLVLTRKAEAVAGQATLAPWLYGVAQRTALKARTQARKRLARQEPLATEPTAQPLPEAETREWERLLQEEVGRLPEKYRLPVVLHYLAGQTKPAAAQQLGLPEGTLSSRLARARETLKRRLTQRGVVLTGTTLVSLLLPRPVPAQLLQRATTPTTASATVLALADGALRGTMLPMCQLGGVLVLCLALACFLGSLSWSASPPPPQSAQQAVPAKPAEFPAKVQGRVTAADTGKPLAGAVIKLLVQGTSAERPLFSAETDADGRYSIPVPLGHMSLWGVVSPPGYYTQEEKTWGQVITTSAQPTVTRDFVLQPGQPWQMRLEGLPLPLTGRLEFHAQPDPDRQLYRNGESVSSTGDAQGRGVLTLPPKGGRYRCGWYLILPEEKWSPLAVNLEIDEGFDPRQVVSVEMNQPTARLRDKAGRGAIVDGAKVSVAGGQVVLHLAVKPLTGLVSFTVRGRVADTAGAPVAGAKATMAFQSGNSGAMSNYQATTDAQGKYELTVQLPPSRIQPDSRISMMVRRSGYHGAATGELYLEETQKTGQGDFGTVTLSPGKTLRGIVVDDNGKQVQGALITNMTNYFLYSHLICRTDAQGRFTMPDLAWGEQKINAVWGERFGETKVDFNAENQECVVIVRHMPKSGIRSNSVPVGQGTPRQPPQEAVAPVPEGKWDLTPPKKEPKYQHEPKYALLAFGPQRAHRVWLVLDGATLYVDRNGNGDLTEPGERLQPNKPDGNNRFAGSGSHTHFDVLEFSVQNGKGGTSSFKLNHWIRNTKYVPTDAAEKQRLALGLENCTLWRQDGLGRGQTPLVFMPKPADAQVCALDGPLTFAVKLPQHQVLQRGEGGSDLSFHIVVQGKPCRGVDHPFHNPLATTEVPAGAYLEVEIEFPAQGKDVPPATRKYLLKERC